MGAGDGAPGDSASDKWKAEGNRAFGEGRYEDAVVSYGRAMDGDGENAILFSNRAFAHLKLENFGSAIIDAGRAISLDPGFIKGYYRRGSALLCLGKHKDALKDFKAVCKMHPNDRDARAKLQACEREVKRMRFEAAIASADEERVSLVDKVDFDNLVVEEGWTGARMDEAAGRAAGGAAGTSADGAGGSEAGGGAAGAGEEGAIPGPQILTLAFVEAMMEDFRNQKLLHKRYAYLILRWARDLLRDCPTLVEVDVPEDAHFTVCGDVHGQYYDLLNIFSLSGMPSPNNPMLFNGDFVDRGSWSTEVIFTLLALKVLYPTGIFLNRGNHETRSMNKIYGFDGEVKAKYSEGMIALFTEVFNYLPLATVLKGEVFVTHGGLFARDGVTLDDIRAVDRFCEPPEEGLMCEMLWSDPGPLPGRQPSKRGVGVSFGADVTRRFLADNGLKLVVRSHEVRDAGYEVEHAGQLITVFSAPNYCDQSANQGAFIRFEGKDMVPRFTQYEAVPHPPVRPMAYASNMMGML